MKLNITPDCGNSPKRELVKNLTIQFASYQLGQVMNYLDDAIEWILVGDVPIVGKEQFMNELKKMSHNTVQTLTIHSIITHGKEAAVHGEMYMQDQTVFAFADFYEFSSAKGNKVKAITSYVIQKSKSISN